MIRIAIAGFALIFAITSNVVPSSAADDGTLCTSEKTPADQALAACGRLINSRRFSGANLASIYFWRAVHANKKGEYGQAIADLTEALKRTPSAASYNMRGSAYVRQRRVRHRDRGFQRRDPAQSPMARSSSTIAAMPGGRRATTRAPPRTTARRSGSIRATRSPIRTAAPPSLPRATLDGALADINEAIRLNPNLPFSFTSRGLLWRAKDELDRAIGDYDDDGPADQGGCAGPDPDPAGKPADQRPCASRPRARGERRSRARAKLDFTAALAIKAADAGSRASQATAKARLAVLSTGDSAPSPMAPPGTGGRRMALVIGNGRYASVGPLSQSAERRTCGCQNAARGGLRGRRRTSTSTASP